MIQSWNYFPSTVYRCELPDWVPAISRSMETLYYTARQNHSSQIPFPINTANVFSCNQTRDQLGYFIEFLNNTSDEILSSQGYNTALYDINVTELWGQELNYGAQQQHHVHSNTILSGIFVISHPGEAGPALVFDDPRPGKSMSQMFMVEHSDVLPGEQHVIFNNLLNGTLIIFNSFLPHNITPNYSNNSFKFLHFCVTSTLKRL